ncbi:hypothetical protein AYI68_g7053, partial [Smittium mucronatum]
MWSLDGLSGLGLLVLIILQSINKATLPNKKKRRGGIHQRTSAVFEQASAPDLVVGGKRDGDRPVAERFLEGRRVEDKMRPVEKVVERA